MLRSRPVLDLRWGSAVSETSSILVKPPWANKWLIAGVTMPALLHLGVLYTPQLASIFQLAPLTKADWYTPSGTHSPAHPAAAPSTACMHSSHIGVRPVSPCGSVVVQVYGRRLRAPARAARGGTQAWRAHHADRVSRRLQPTADGYSRQPTAAHLRRRLQPTAAHLRMLVHALRARAEGRWTLRDRWSAVRMGPIRMDESRVGFGARCKRCLSKCEDRGVERDMCGSRRSRAAVAEKRDSRTCIHGGG